MNNFITFGILSFFISFSISAGLESTNISCDQEALANVIKEPATSSTVLVATVSKIASTINEKSTFLTISKNINNQNVLHYKAVVDQSTCTFSSVPYATWDMGGNGTNWKPIEQSSASIQSALGLDYIKKISETHYLVDLSVTRKLSDEGVDILDNQFVHFKVVKHNGQCIEQTYIQYEGNDNLTQVLNFDVDMTLTAKITNLRIKNASKKVIHFNGVNLTL